MEVVCVILAAGWFAVGWLAASAHQRRSRLRLEQTKDEGSGDLSSRLRSPSPIGERMTRWDSTVTPGRTEIRRETLSEPQRFAGPIPAEQLPDDRPSSSRTAAEHTSREFLAFCNQHEVSWEQARDWFGSRGMDCDRLMGDADSWYLVAVSERGADGNGIGIPAIRRAMGAVPLADYFELTRYNGLDPLEPRNVVEFCEIRLADFGIVRKGVIHGR